MVTAKKRMRPANGILHITEQQFNQIRGALETYGTSGYSFRYDLFLEGWLTSQGWDADSFKYKPLEIRVHNMAWNYETGREEASPYGDNRYGPLSSARPKRTTQQLKGLWLAMEANLQAIIYPNGLDVIQAIEAFQELEKSMHSDDIVKTAQSRMDYIAWLTAGKPTAPQPVSQKDTLDSLGTVGKIVSEGYRSLSKRAHPDTGGTSADFQELQKAKKVLDRILYEVKDIL